MEDLENFINRLNKAEKVLSSYVIEIGVIETSDLFRRRKEKKHFKCRS